MRKGRWDRKSCPFRCASRVLRCRGRRVLTPEACPPRESNRRPPQPPQRAVEFPDATFPWKFGPGRALAQGHTAVSRLGPGLGFDRALRCGLSAPFPRERGPVTSVNAARRFCFVGMTRSAKSIGITGGAKALVYTALSHFGRGYASVAGAGRCGTSCSAPRARERFFHPRVSFSIALSARFRSGLAICVSEVCSVARGPFA